MALLHLANVLHRSHHSQDALVALRIALTSSSPSTSSSSTSSVYLTMGNVLAVSSLTHPLTYSLTHSLTHPLTHSLSHSLTHSHAHPLTHSLTHLPTHPSTHSLAHSPTHSGVSTTCPLTHSITHSPTHPLTLSLDAQRQFQCLHNEEAAGGNGSEHSKQQREGKSEKIVTLLT